MCLPILIAAVVLLIYEWAVVLLYKWIKKEQPVVCIWIIMGSKVAKLLLAALALLGVAFFAHEHLIDAAWVSLGALLVGMLFETLYFIRDGKSTNKS